MASEALVFRAQAIVLKKSLLEQRKLCKDQDKIIQTYKDLVEKQVVQLT